MAVQQGYGKMAGTDALVFAYDTGDAVNSYKGEPTENLIADPLYNQGVISDYLDVNNTGWGTITRGRVEDVSGPFGKIVKAYSQELISYTSGNRSMEGQVSDVVDNINARFYLTAGLTYNLSIWIKANYTGSSSNRLYISGTAAVGEGTTREVNTEWQHISRNFTPTESGNYYMRHYAYAGGKPVGSKIWYALPQVELKNHATPFVNGTRSATEGLLDLTGNNAIDLTNTSYDSNAQMTFDATDDYININSVAPLIAGGDFSLEAIIKGPTQDHKGIIPINTSTGGNRALFLIRHASMGIYDGGTWYIGNIDVDDNNWHHVMLSYTRSTKKAVIYVDGEVSLDATTNNMITVATDDRISIGQEWDGASTSDHFNGEIPVAKIYNKALTAAELKSNFNNYKTRFNIA